MRRKKLFWPAALLLCLALTLSACSRGADVEQEGSSRSIQDPEGALQLVKQQFHEQDSRSFLLGDTIEIEEAPYQPIEVLGLLREGSYPIAQFAVNPDQANRLYYLNKLGEWEAIEALPTFAALTSPNGALRVEGFGINAGHGFPTTAQRRLIDTATGEVLWSAENHPHNGVDDFRWSPDGDRVAIGYYDGITMSTDIMEVADLSITPLPGPEALLAAHPELPPPASPTGHSAIHLWNWEGDTVVSVQFRWSAADSAFVIGRYTYDLTAGALQVGDWTVTHPQAKATPWGIPLSVAADPEDPAPALELVQSLFQEPDSRVFRVGEQVELEGTPAQQVAVSGLLSGGAYPIVEFAIPLELEPPFYYREGGGDWVLFWNRPSFACRTSPDGQLRAESLGMNYDSGSGIHALARRRLIDTATGELLWSDDGCLQNEFVWSPEGRYLATQYSGRYWVDTDVVDTADYSLIPLPALEELLAADPLLPAPAAGRPSMSAQRCDGWESETTLAIAFGWWTEDGVHLSGRYRCDLASGRMTLLGWLRDESN